MAYRIIDLPAFAPPALGTEQMELSLAGASGSRRITLAALRTAFFGGGGSFVATDSINAGSLAIVQGVISAQAAGLSQTVTWNNAAVLFSADVLNVTDTNSLPNSILMDRQINGSSVFSVLKSGDLVVHGNGIGGGITIGFGGGAINTNLALGVNSLSANTTGIQNLALGVSSLSANTTGSYNLALGINSLLANTTGNINLALGVNSLSANTTGSTNLALGVNSLSANTTGNGSIALGFNAGKYATVGNELYINNQDRVNTAGDQTLSLLYGIMAATVAGQSLTVNAATLTVTGNLVLPNAGNGLSIKSGANSRFQEVVLAAGTSGAIANTSVTANTKLMLTHRLLGGTVGVLGYTTTAGTGYTVTSSSALDTSTVEVLLIEMT